MPRHEGYPWPQWAPRASIADCAGEPTSRARQFFDLRTWSRLEFVRGRSRLSVFQVAFDPPSGSPRDPERRLSLESQVESDGTSLRSQVAQNAPPLTADDSLLVPAQRQVKGPDQVKCNRTPVWHHPRS